MESPSRVCKNLKRSAPVKHVAGAEMRLTPKKQKKTDNKARPTVEDNTLKVDLDAEEDFITKTEQVHLGHLKKLVRIQKLFVPSSVEDCKDKDYSVLLKSYYSKVDKNGNLSVTYRFKNNGQFGRLFAKGMASPYFPSTVRDFLFPDYINVDMRAAVFTIYRHYSERYNIPSPELLQLLEKRDEILQKKQLTKKKLNALMNTMTPPKRDKFLINLHGWIHSKLLPKLKVDPEYKNLWIAIDKSPDADPVTGKKKNKDVSFLCLCYQTIERHILIHMSEFFENRGWTVGALIYDGLLVQKDKDKILNDALLRECEESIYNRLKIRVTLAEKPRDIDETFLKRNHLDLEDVDPDNDLDDTDLDTDLDNRDVVDLVPDDEPLSLAKSAKIFGKGTNLKGLIRYLNNFFTKITEEDTALYCYREKRSDPWICRTYKNTSSALSHLFLHSIDKNGKGVIISLFDQWAGSQRIITYKKVVFDPSYIGDIPFKEINLFKGFQATLLDQYDEKIIEPVLSHIRQVLNGSVEECWQYTEKWMASIVQHPQIKTEVALVFHGSQGTGKNLLMDNFFGRLVIGMKHFLNTNNLDDLTGQFTGHLSAKIFTIGDEVLFAGGHKTNNILKSRITQNVQKMEKKGVDAITIGDFNNYSFLSNHDDAVKIENTDRRYFVKRASDIHKGDTEYFATFAEKCLNQETADHFYTYLMQMDLTGFNLCKIPVTEEKAEMAIYSMDPLELFVDDLLNGNISKGFTYVDGERTQEWMLPGETYEMTMDELFSLYQTFLQSGAAGRRLVDMSKMGFSKKIRRMVQIANLSHHRHGGTRIAVRMSKVN
ncbi:uncharacterized protein SPPG_07597 [Spizellomyces punctatus DAOM BR117]|uniref:NrS-1 polymerase-like helicase domain-containing protein n=1 Tax=Spizellomyces punctatus (strain DAOM BR117) TaxID=645134 RepID=A0A0L0H6S9_SPIPD|nr:uncharacterized protein SPPG_07597 [Spizellomyces punctatus DAOM BR117]KNC97210.1 hypothetical protein SPPG_07597 [Spizellomyces punctatus DAOM BR117]|eukprot:XP_016605250.1 hypothetical protein SPPG_07597 [Spizellomyces punctatus DAOM BR117]